MDRRRDDINLKPVMSFSCDAVFLFADNKVFRQHCKPSERKQRAEVFKNEGFMSFNDVIFVKDSKEDMYNAMKFMSDAYVSYIDSPMCPAP